jgi:ATP-dependent Clp protease ATP-binding subunit ClpA
MLSDLSKVLDEKGISFEYTEPLVDYLSDKGYSDKYGARNLRRIIQTDIEDKIANEIVANYKTPIKKVIVDSQDGNVILTTEK